MALQTSLFLNLVNVEEKLMQVKNTSDIKLNVPRSRKMSRSRPINVSVSSRTQNWTSRSREKWEDLGLVSNWKPNVSVSDLNVSFTSLVYY